MGLYVRGPLALPLRMTLEGRVLAREFGLVLCLLVLGGGYQAAGSVIGGRNVFTRRVVVRVPRGGGDGGGRGGGGGRYGV